jgi:hypothetical protein
MIFNKLKHFRVVYHSIVINSGGNLGGAGGPPTFVENVKFSEILTYKRAKPFRVQMGGGGVVGNLKVLSEI